MESPAVIESPPSEQLEVLAARAQHNASLPLLRLPQEIKDQICELVCRGQFLHIHHVLDDSHPIPVLKNTICWAEMSEEDAERSFYAKKSKEWYVEEGNDRHRPCYGGQRMQDKHELNMNILLSCRQIYAEANSTLYSMNTFSFDDPWTLERFGYSLLQPGYSSHHRAIRRVHLHIFWRCEGEHRKWTKMISTMPKVLSNLRHINISMDQGHSFDAMWFCTRREWACDNESGWTTILDTLDGFSELNINSVTFSISDKGLEERWMSFINLQDYEEDE